MLDISNFDFHNYRDYAKFRQLENPITSKNISIFEEFNIDTDLFETNTQYHDYVSDLYSQTLAYVNKEMPDFALFYDWDTKIRNYYETEGGLSGQLILYFKFAPETVSFLEKMYKLDVTGKVESFLKNFRDKYYSSEIPLVFEESKLINILGDAIEANNVERIKKCFAQFHPEDLDQNFYAVSDIDNPELLKYLYDNYTISDVDVQLSLFSGAESGYLDNVKYLLSLNKHDDDIIDRSIIAASENGHLSIVRVLLATNMVTNDGIDISFYKSLTYRHIKVAQELLNTDRITDETINDAYLENMYDDKAKEILLATQKITPETLAQEEQEYLQNYRK